MVAGDLRCRKQPNHGATLKQFAEVGATVSSPRVD